MKYLVRLARVLTPPLSYPLQAKLLLPYTWAWPTVRGDLLNSIATTSLNSHSYLDTHKKNNAGTNAVPQTGDVTIMNSRDLTGKFLLSFLLSTTLAACGGGGGGSGGPLRPPASLTGENPPPTPPTNTTRSLGSGTGSDFVEGALEVGIGNNTLSHGGVTTLAVNFVDENGALAKEAIDVVFSSACVEAGHSKLSSAKVSTSTGRATTNYTAAGCAGSDTLSASVTYKDTVLNAMSTLNVASENVHSIGFVDANPSLIRLKGTGGAETSVVRFKVLNGIGAPVKNACLNFSLNTSAGGLALADTKCAASDTLPGARSDAEGYVSIIVQAGNVATPVTITAIEQHSGVSTQSSGLRVSTGIPDQKGFSLAVSKFNPSAWETDGVTVDIPVLLSDAFNNRPADGTVVSFRTSGGGIQESCTVVEGGCTVKWRSQDPRPSDGRVVIMAHTNGNETFIDSNGNGLYDFEAFTDESEGEGEGGNGVYDVAEPFTDANKNGLYDFEAYTDTNENGAYDAFEPFTDANENGLYDFEAYTDTNGNRAYDEAEIFTDANGNGVHDADIFATESPLCEMNNPPSSATNSADACDDLNEAYVDENSNGLRDNDEDFVDLNNSISFTKRNGIYNGVLCTDVAQAFGKCTKKGVSIREDATIIMSSKTPQLDVNRRLTGQPATISVPGSITVTAADFHGNTLPQGSVVSIVTNSATGLKVNKESYTVPNSAGVQRYTFVLTRSSANTPADGTISFEVTAPDGIGAGTVTTSTNLTTIN